ncbi:MAG TPA: hypothetical protein VM716_09660 [Gemmatimonadales bacterium]|nr:hypothetical protein [Gemmatimonadales bacterium]
MKPVLALVLLGVLQGTQPLRKAELIRLLATGAMTKPAIASLVRRNCVTFRPTARDRAELRTAGADAGVLAAIDQCLESRQALAPRPHPRAPSPQPPTAPAPPLHVIVTRELSAPIGSETEVRVQLFRGAVPERGVLLILRGASAIPGGVTQDPTAITDERGIASFRILAGTTPGAYRLSVAEPNAGAAPFGDTGEIAFVTTPISQPAARPAPPPPPKPIPAEQRTQFIRGESLHGTVGGSLGAPLVLEVRDETGTPIAHEAVAFTATGGGGGTTVRPATTQTDVAGIAEAQVTLGQRAGPVVVTARVGSFTRTATLYADPGPARALVVMRGDTPVTGLDLRARDTLVVRVVARDAFGNATALENFAVTATGRALALGGAARVDSAGVVMLVPRRSGMATLELLGSGLQARVPVTVALPSVTAVGPWAIGARSAWLGLNTPWLGSALTSVSGADFALFGRRTLIAGLSVAAGGVAGSLNGDRATTAGSVSVLLLEGYGGAEWSLVPGAVVSPVLSVGAGVYRLKSGDDGQTVYHTSEFWSGGVGADVVVSTTVTAELRVERHWMRDAGQGHVATLWPVAAGVRVAL